MITMTASELRDGDILRTSKGSENYVKVAKAEPVARNQIAVTIYNGGVPNERPYRNFKASETVQVSVRLGAAR